VELLRGCGSKMQTEVKQNIGTALQSPNKGGVYRRYIKRPMDFVLSLIAIIVLSPVFLVVAVLVRIKLGSPVIFKQERPGLNEKIFTLYKFRSMTDERDENGELLPNNLRLTKFGKFLRASSLDELPELFNILCGDMSIVGPRPLLVEYLPLYNEIQKHRHDVRPGLTGFAQVNGRNAITWEERFDYDLQYVEKVSFLLDVKIIFRTVEKVFKREGINKSEAVTMEKFTGTKVEINK
jgi:lipopolysaccharide/colanic/teichoic acid biosynthesis glycosyltransferase